MSTRHINSLMLNPFLGSEIITHFLSGYFSYPINQKEFSTHYSYLILPFVLAEPVRDTLSHSNASSNIFTVFISNAEKRACLGGVEEQIITFQELTKLSLIVAHNKGDIKISDTITLINPQKYSKSNDSVRSYLRAAFYLGLFFSKEASMVDVYEKLLLS